MLKKIIYKENLIPLMLKNEWFFIHIPKCAGRDFFIKNFGINYGHKTLKFYQKQLGNKFQQYQFFSIVRDPIDRFKSAFYFLKSGGMNQSDSKYYVENKEYFENIDSFTEALFHKKIKTYLHFKPQHLFLSDKRGNFNSVIVFKIENLEKEIELRQDHLPSSFIACLKNLLQEDRKNVTRLKDNEISNETEEYIRALYEKDFELLGYD